MLYVSAFRIRDPRFGDRDMPDAVRTAFTRGFLGLSTNLDSRRAGSTACLRCASGSKLKLQGLRGSGTLQAASYVYARSVRQDSRFKNKLHVIVMFVVHGTDMYVEEVTQIAPHLGPEA